MKKATIFITTFTIILALSGCNQANLETSQLPADVQPTVDATIPERPENNENTASPPAPITPDYSTLTTAPKLMVSTLNNVDNIVVGAGNFEWSIEMPDGTMGSIVACGAGPLDDISEPPVLYTAFPAGSLPPLNDGQDVGSIMPTYYLNFGEIPPETVTVRRWLASYVGDYENHYEDFEDVIAEYENGAFTLYPGGDGEFVYEIYAEWGEVGNAYYIFRTLPQVRGNAETRE